MAEQSIKTMIDPKDIAQLAVFLASDDSSFMLGSEVLADGGSAMRYA